jgi:hypothetical protein
VNRSIHLHQLAKASASGTTTTVRFPAALPLPESLRDQPTAERLGSDVQTVSGQLLAGEGRSEVGIVLAVGSEDGLAKLVVGLMVGRFTAKAVDDGGIAAGLQSSQDASDLAGTFVEQPCGLGLSAFTTQDGMHDLKDIAFFLTHRYPVGGKDADRHDSSLA